MYQDNIPGNRKRFLLCRPLYYFGLQPCFPKGKKNTFYYIYRNMSKIYTFTYIQKDFDVFFSWKCIHLYMYVPFKMYAFKYL